MNIEEFRKLILQQSEVYIFYVSNYSDLGKNYSYSN